MGSALELSVEQRDSSRHLSSREPVTLSLFWGDFGWRQPQARPVRWYFSLPSPQGSSSSDSLEGQSCDYASKSYDAVVFDVLKVTPEEFAVSDVELMWMVVLLQGDGGSHYSGFLPRLGIPHMFTVGEQVMEKNALGLQLAALGGTHSVSAQ